MVFSACRTWVARGPTGEVYVLRPTAIQQKQQRHLTVCEARKRQGLSEIDLLAVAQRVQIGRDARNWPMTLLIQIMTKDRAPYATAVGHLDAKIAKDVRVYARRERNRVKSLGSSIRSHGTGRHRPKRKIAVPVGFRRLLSRRRNDVHLGAGDQSAARNIEDRSSDGAGALRGGRDAHDGEDSNGQREDESHTLIIIGRRLL